MTKGNRVSAYGLAITVDAAFDDAVAATRAALADQGFGVLTEIDVRATMREKLDEEIDPYLVLGACNPPLALRGLRAEPSLGLLLPCNVTVRRGADGATHVEAVDPSLLVQLSANPDLEPVADAATDHLRAALDAVATALQR